MPKIFGVSVLGILAATIALYMVGFLWYGILFMQPWQEMTQVAGGDMNAKMILSGLLVCLLPAMGLAAVLHWASASKLVTCVKVGVTIAILITIPVLAAGNIYEYEPLGLLAIDGSHAIVGYGIMGAVLSLFLGETTKE